MSINEILHEELLEKIFSYITVRDRLLFVSAVCRKWRKILGSFSDVKSLEIFDLHDEICCLDFECPFRKASNRPTEFPLPEIWLLKFLTKILPRFGVALQSLSFQIRTFTNIPRISIRLEIMECVLRVCPNLTELNFMRCDLAPPVVDMLPLFEHLHILKVIKQNAIDDVWPRLLTARSRGDGVTSLETELDFGPNFFELENRKFGGALKRLHILSPRNEQNDSNSNTLPTQRLVEQYPALVELDIRSCKISDWDLCYVSELRQLRILSISLTERTNLRGFYEICNKCHRLEDLTLFDYESDGTLDLSYLIDSPGMQLKRFAFNSMKMISDQQLKKIKKLKHLTSLILRTNKLPSIETSSDKSECTMLEELAISSTNQPEKACQYKLFTGVCKGLTKIGYLPRGWSLHTNDGIEPDALERYLTSMDDPDKNPIVKLLLYARDTDTLTDLSKFSFPELTGLIVFGNCAMSDECAGNISGRCPKLAYVLTESNIRVTCSALISLLSGRCMAELHAKYNDLIIDNDLCYAIGNSPALKFVGFKGMLMVNKVKFCQTHWNQVMEGRNDLFRRGLTCQRTYIDCFYSRIWPKKLACIFRTLWLSCKAVREIVDDAGASTNAQS